MRLDQAPAIAALLLATLSATAIQAADLIRFDDASEHLNIYWNGNLVTGNIGPISNLSISSVAEPGGGQGEVVIFDYSPISPVLLALSDGSNSNLPYVYTQLREVSVNGAIVVSDEFGIRPHPNGAPNVFQVYFGSADQPLLQQQFPGIQPSPLSGLEVAAYQDMAYVVWPGPAGPTEATFQVISVPEPATFAMLLAGMGLLGGLAQRKQRH